MMLHGNVNIIVCIGRCSNFEEVPCFRRDRFIGACNGCSEIKGQSIYTILQNHKEITQCEKTIYTYIEMGLFKFRKIKYTKDKRR